MDPLYELATRLLYNLFPEWGTVYRRKRRDRQTSWLKRLLPDWVLKDEMRQRDALSVPTLKSGLAEALEKELIQAVGSVVEPRGTGSLHVKRIAVTRLLYERPEFALLATRLVGRYPRYYEEVAQDLSSRPEVPEQLQRHAARADGLLAAYRAGAVGWTAADIADRLVADYWFAVEATGAFEMARPFALVLASELAEIDRSRGRRELSDLERRDVEHTRAAPGGAAIAPGAAYTGGVPAAGLPSPFDLAKQMHLAGLAISGGGIRSATFSLGIIQALASLDLLRRFDYISTVSGGGYVGSWLVAWIKRLNGGVREVQQRLCPQRGSLPTERDSRPLRMLREYSNYLTPSVGMFTADTWTAIAVWLRNTLLNQLVLVAFLAAAVLVPWLVLVLGAEPAAGGRWMFDARMLSGMLWGIQASLAIMLAVVALVVGAALNDFDDARHGAEGRGARGLGWTDTGIAGIVGGAALVGSWLTALCVLAIRDGYWQLVHPALRDMPALAAAWLNQAQWQIAIVAAPAFLIGLLVIQTIGRYVHCMLKGEARPSWLRRVLAWFKLAIAAPIPAVAGALMLVLAAEIAPWVAGLVRGDPLVFQLVLLPPLVMESLALTVILHVGLLGRWLPDDRREWWSRLGAHQLRFAIAWAVICGIALLSPSLLRGRIHWPEVVSALTWIATTVGGVLAARKPETGDAHAPTLKTRLLELLARVAPMVFVLGLVVLVSLAVYKAIGPETVGEVAAAIAVLLAVGLLLSWRIDINEFSMHHFYKNRLVRCYLGASRDLETRRPNRFTGFDSNDDVPLASLVTAATHTDNPELREYKGPYPIINTALNLTKGSELAWQERKAESFVFTPLACGYDLTENRVTGDARLRLAAYRPTDQFAYRGGPHIGTAVAISGAAASPNMGYHSSPAVAFLMTMFNVRLGWWVGNPRYSSLVERVRSPWRKSSPSIGALYLLKELFGRTDNQSQYINLSDGGHFENLGIYELVRRRCRYVVAIDAEEDGAMALGGLAGVIRKCRTDFGVDIQIDIGNIVPDPKSRAHCAVGRIRYPETRASRMTQRREGVLPDEEDDAPPMEEGDEDGWLFYIKASLTGDETPDVREYRVNQPAFPHESTGDQWFSESQFESYRTLGFQIGMDGLQVAAATKRTWQGIFSLLQEIWTPMNVAQDRLERHADSYAKLYEHMAGASSTVAPAIDPLLFPTMNQPTPLQREQMYPPKAAIELMHQVFLDLELDRFPDRPHQAGWIRIFRGWKRAAPFQTVWPRVRPSYNRRFRSFVDRL